MQTNINEWEEVDKQINRSKIKRFPYKQLLGIALTKYILDCRGGGLSSHQTIARILREESVIRYLEQNSCFDKFKENIRISVCARYSEESMRSR